MKSKIIELLMSTEREGITDLIKHMEDNGFFEAPCSSQYHLCEVGGLAAHSLNVYDTMFDMICNVATFRYIEESNESITIVSLLHDLGKMGQYGKKNYTPNILKSGEISKTKPFETNKDLLPVPHEIRSIHIASQFINLTEEEAFAILHHNGLYGDLKYQLQGKETPLQMLLHFADMWASRVIEKEE